MIIYELFSKFFAKVFLKLYLIIELKEWFKANVLNFSGKFLLFLFHPA